MSSILSSAPWHLLLALAGLLVIYTEFLLAPQGGSGENEGDKSYFWFTWFGLGFLLIAESVGFSADEILTRWHHSSPTTEISPVLLVIASSRLIFLRLAVFAPNKHPSLVGDAARHLLGHVGILTKHITPAEPGFVRMKNSIFSDDTMECISDDALEAGALVKVVEIDCGMLKVIALKKEADFHGRAEIPK